MIIGKKPLLQQVFFLATKATGLFELISGQPAVFFAKMIEIWMAAVRSLDHLIFLRNDSARSNLFWSDFPVRIN